MFDRFTHDLREALGAARKEAMRWGHASIGTEHQLLGFLDWDRGPGYAALVRLGLDPRTIRTGIARRVPRGKFQIVAGTAMPFTAQAKKVLEHAAAEAQRLFHEHMGTEHLLLGFVAEQEGVAGQILRDLGLTPERTRQAVILEAGLGARTEGASAPAHALLLLATRDRPQPVLTGILKSLLPAMGVGELRTLHADEDDPGDVLAGLLQASLVIAVPAGAGPGFFHATGVCRGMGRRTLLLVAESEGTPAPLRGMPALHYDPARVGMPTFKEQLRRVLPDA